MNPYTHMYRVFRLLGGFFSSCLAEFSTSIFLGFIVKSGPNFAHVAVGVFRLIGGCLSTSAKPVKMWERGRRG